MSDMEEIYDRAMLMALHGVSLERPLTKEEKDTMKELFEKVWGTKP
jgi:hypothetical protein